MIEHDIKHEEQADSNIYKQASANMDDGLGEQDADDYRYSLKYAFELFTQGEPIWWALGNFANDFFVYFPDERQSLVDEEIELPAQATPEQRQWAVFFAASAEYLAHKYGLSVPSWSQNEAYKLLGDRWYFEKAALRLDDIRESEEQETPLEYKQRNIICGKRVWYNKKERIA